jgi:hypothetical protein
MDRVLISTEWYFSTVTKPFSKAIIKWKDLMIDKTKLPHSTPLSDFFFGFQCFRVNSILLIGKTP